MVQTEYIRNLNCNYERIHLKEKPQEQKFQYCMINRGGIKGLLSCSLRYIDEEAYLYYDISSKQSVAHLYRNKALDREFLRDFGWAMQMVKQELERFLLDWQNVVWFPEHIYYDLEENRLFFLYIPYYEEDSGFAQFMEFLIEKVDYDDEDLVNCVYHMYERYENCGESYLQKQIFNDIEEVCSKQRERLSLTESILIAEKLKRGNRADEEAVESVESDVPSEESCEEKRGLLGFFDAIRRKKSVQLEVSDWNADRAGELRMVAEQNAYEGESYGKTVFVELRDEFGKARGLYYPDGKLLYYIEETHVVGKMKGEADIVLDDASISRMHARITKREGKYYLEDLNSTNGTYKNGIRLQPYEEKELEEGDDVRFGRVLLVFR